MRHEENYMRLHVCMHRVTSAWAIVLGLIVLVIAGPASAQPVDIPATWGGDFWSRPRLTGSWGGLRDELGKKGVVLDIDLLQTPQVVASGGRDEVGRYWGLPSTTLNVDTRELGLVAGRLPQSPGHEQLGQNVNVPRGRSSRQRSRSCPSLGIHQWPHEPDVHAIFQQALRGDHGKILRSAGTTTPSPMTTTRRF
jgi:hypothetical protein